LRFDFSRERDELRNVKRGEGEEEGETRLKPGLERRKMDGY